MKDKVPADWMTADHDFARPALPACRSPAAIQTRSAPLTVNCSEPAKNVATTTVAPTEDS